MCFDNLNEILSLYLEEKKWKKYYPNIVFSLYCVNKGFKPSLLWDIGPNLEIDVLKKLINHLKEISFMKSYVYLLKYEDEIFIINLKKICQHLKLFSCDIKFVDCSLNNEKPVIIECNKLQYMTDVICFLIKYFYSLLELHNKRDICFDSLLHLKFEKNIKFCCPPTVFGILLGYPVVYWSTDILMGNCLSFVPLSVYKLKIIDPIIPKVVKDNIFCSFSVPVSLNLDNFIDNWLETLNNLISAEVILSKDVVTLPCVQL